MYVSLLLFLIGNLLRGKQQHCCHIAHLQGPQCLRHRVGIRLLGSLVGIVYSSHLKNEIGLVLRTVEMIMAAGGWALVRTYPTGFVDERELPFVSIDFIFVPV